MTNEQREAVDSAEIKKSKMRNTLDYEQAYIKLRQQYEELTSIVLIKNEEIKKKDKQINLMAEYISNQDVEENICIKNITNPDWCNEDYTNCKDCIKQYFADLVEKETKET